MNEEAEQIYFMGSRKPWKPQPWNMNRGIPQDSSQYFNNINLGRLFVPFSPSWPQSF